MGESDDAALRTVWFTVNGHARQVQVRDRSRAVTVAERRRADPNDARQVGATMPGTVIALHAKVGSQVSAGAPLLTLEAMKMEQVVRAPKSGTLKELVPQLKSAVQPGDLLALIE